jgi:hypothetical protein
MLKIEPNFPGGDTTRIFFSATAIPTAVGVVDHISLDKHGSEENI